MIPLLPLAGYWLVLIYYLGAQWSVYDQYNYGWAVPFLCVYLLWRRKQTAESRKQKSGGESEGQGAEDGKEEAESRKQRLEPDLARYQYVSFSAFQLFSVCLLCLLYAPTRFLHEANPVWRLTSWLWALEVVALTLLLLRSTDYGPQTTDRLSRCTVHAARFTFPICFFLVAVPWPSGLETPITQSLMRSNTAVTVELLGLFGVPAVQHGNVIEIGSGMVGIDEACSGIRSLQATLMISLFLGEVYALTVRRRALCVLAGFALAFLFNMGRTLLLTRVAATKGVGAVASWHDPAGVTILLGCFLSLWLIARGLRRAEGRRESAEGRGGNAETLESMGQKPAGSRQWSVVSGQWSRGLVVPLCLLAWLVLVEAGTELWYRSHEHATIGGKQWSVQAPEADPAFQVVPIPAGVGSQFKSDSSLEARWRDGTGNAWQLYYFRWLPALSLKKRITIQLAKTHGPERCLPRAGMKLKAYLGIITVPLAGLDLTMQQYQFDAEGTPLHVFYGIYEDPTGITQLANRRKDTGSRIAAALAGSRNYGQRFLEVAAAGYEKPEDARAALAQELEKLIKVEK